MNNPNQPESFDTDAELEAHLAELEAEAPAHELSTPPDDVQGERRRVRDLKRDIDHLRNEIENLRTRLAVIREQATTVVGAELTWADASAHAQLGSYPWAKLAGAMAATFICTRLLKRLPLRRIAGVAIPLIAARLDTTPYR
jgi:hypothetical protein